MSKNKCRSPRKGFSDQLLWFLPMVVFTLLIAGCNQDNKPLRIGLIGTFSGKYADIGNDTLVGVRIAVNEINDQGGINGRSVKLVIKDDRGSGEAAITAARELAAAGITTIIGPNLSTVAVKLVPWCTEQGILLLTPTVSTSQLAGIDDAMIRVFAHNRPDAGQVVADYIAQELEQQNGVILYDAGNAAYTEDIVTYAERAMVAAGIKVKVVPFLTDKDFDYGATIDDILTQRHGFIYLVAAALDTAMFSWQVRKQQLPAQLIFNHWAISDELYRIGNEAVEGALFLSDHFPADKSAFPEFRRFRRQVAEQTTRTSYKFMIYGYEASQVLFAGLRRSGDSLKQTILDLPSFSGLFYNFSIDRFGDVKRPYFATRIKNGAAVPFEVESSGRDER